MLKEAFIGRNPSHFHMDRIVEAFIVSETLLWSAWNFVTPIFAIFVINSVKGANIQIAASAFSVYLITRVLFEIIAGRYLSKRADGKKFTLTILGMSLMSFAYVGFSMSNTVFQLFLFYVFIGIGLGIATPAKSTLFTEHLDRGKATTEWSLYDAVTLIGVASATALGGFIANAYGFSFLFILAAIVNALGIIPYILYRD